MKNILTSFSIVAVLAGCTQQESELYKEQQDLAAQLEEAGYVEILRFEDFNGDVIEDPTSVYNTRSDGNGNGNGNFIKIKELKDNNGQVVASFKMAQGRRETRRVNVENIDSRLDDGNTEDDNYWQLTRDMGGTLELLLWQDSASAEEVRDKYREYGLDIDIATSTPQTRAADAPQALKDACATKYLTSWADKTWDLGPHNVSIDKAGRPFFGVVEINFGLFTPGSANKYCTRQIGNFSRPLTDHGGHLIPAALGGWHKRANVVPQNEKTNLRAFNVRIEDAMRNCVANIRSLIKYGVTARYPDQYNLRPNMFEAEAWVSRVPYNWATLYQGIPLYFNAKIRNEVPNAVDLWFADEFKKGVDGWCHGL